jgi:hypothetical protein
MDRFGSSKFEKKYQYNSRRVHGSARKKVALLLDVSFTIETGHSIRDVEPPPGLIPVQRTLFFPFDS